MSYCIRVWSFPLVALFFETGIPKELCLSIDFINTTYASNDLIVILPRVMVNSSGNRFSFTGMA